VKIDINDILKQGVAFQSFKLKNKLFDSGLKKKNCEICEWCQMSKDGRIPLELDHINGDRLDNRIENLRILCPNCHSLQITHRGKNKRRG
jgi:5-methylcytosine-specific restriction endonuclease McrA